MPRRFLTWRTPRAIRLRLARRPRYWDLPHDCDARAAQVRGAPVTGAHHTLIGNETDLMLALTRGPVSVAIYSSLASFEGYAGGIFSDAKCEAVTERMLDHGVLAVGYGATAAGAPYWKIKNSWGDECGASSNHHRSRVRPLRVVVERVAPPRSTVACRGRESTLQAHS